MPVPLPRAPRRQVRIDAPCAQRALAGVLVADRDAVDVEPVEREADVPAGRLAERGEPAPHDGGVVQLAEARGRRDLVAVRRAAFGDRDGCPVAEGAARSDRSVVGCPLHGPRDRCAGCAAADGGGRDRVVERLDLRALAVVLVARRVDRRGAAGGVAQLQRELVDVVGARRRRGPRIVAPATQQHVRVDPREARPRARRSPGRGRPSRRGTTASGSRPAGRTPRWVARSRCGAGRSGSRCSSRGTARRAARAAARRAPARAPAARGARRAPRPSRGRRRSPPPRRRLSWG